MIRTITVGIAVAAFAVLAPREAAAQYHEPCWYRQKSPYQVTGAQPSSSQIWTKMRSLAQAHNVPVEVIAAVAGLESGWKQFAADGYVIHNQTSCVNLYWNASSQPNPPDVGLMQLAGVTAAQFDVQRLISDFGYNLESGVKVLVGKWNAYYGSICPSWYSGRPTDHDRMVLENWYYPLKMYNGWANLSDFGYVELVYGRMESPPPPASAYVFAVRVTRPGEAIPGYTLPPAPGKYVTYFKAFSPGNRFMDGNYNNYYSKPTHRGTYGVTVVSIAPKAYKCATSVLNVRAGPGTGYDIRGQLQNGMVYVADAKDESSTWYRIFFDGKYGWCHGSYLAATTGVTGVKVTVSELNVRSGAGTSYSILGKVYSGQIYIRVGTSGGWSRINWKGTTGWVYSAYTTAVGF